MNDEYQGNAEDLHSVLDVTLEQLYNGAELQVDIHRRSLCDLCDATGIVDYFYECRRCSGSGIEIDYVNTWKHMRITCRACEGRGEINRCKKCNGMGFPRQRVSIDVNVERGMCDGEKIVLSGHGHQELNMGYGDVVVMIHEIKHPIYTRNNNDLSVTLQISFTESLCGFRKVIKTLDDRQLVVTSEPGKVYVNDDIKYLHNEGMPIYKDPTQKGNLHVHFKVVEVPNHIAWKHLATLEKILPGRKTPPDISIDAEDCNMRNVRKLRLVQREGHPQDQQHYQYQDEHPHFRHPQDHYEHDHYPHDQYPYDQHPQNEDIADDYEPEFDFEIEPYSGYHDDVAGQRSP